MATTPRKDDPNRDAILKERKQGVGNWGKRHDLTQEQVDKANDDARKKGTK